MKEQIIRLSEGCPYKCSFCFNGKIEFKEFPIPEIVSNRVVLHDSAFLSKKDVRDVIKELGKVRVNGKVVYYELTEGVNLHDLDYEIAILLKRNHFINIRFAWDDSYTKKSFYRIYDGIRMLLFAGYKKEKLMCYILSNYYVPLIECLYKAKVMLYHHIPVCVCDYRKNYLDSKVYYDYWTEQQVKFFRDFCRSDNQIVKYKGYDPEIEKRVIRTKKIPLKELR